MKVCPDCKHVVLRPRVPVYECFECGGTLVETDPNTGDTKALPLSETLPRMPCEMLGGKKSRRKMNLRLSPAYLQTDRPQTSVPRRVRKQDFKSQALRKIKSECRETEFRYSNTKGVIKHGLRKVSP